MSSATKKRVRVNKWLDAIERILQKQDIPLAQLARDIGKDTQYIQVLKWLRWRQNEPRGEIMLSLIEWALQRDRKLIALLNIN